MAGGGWVDEWEVPSFNACMHAWEESGEMLERERFAAKREVMESGVPSDPL